MRYKTLRSRLKRNIEFEPRRRQDIDFIFLITGAQAAQQIKPTLKYYYAGDIPLYTISKAYSEDDQQRNRDIDGILLPTAPWQLEADKHLQVKAQQSVPASYRGLYSFGIDAYLLHNRVEQLSQRPQMQLDGYTGKLKMQEQKILREQPWATLANGTPVPLRASEYSRKQPLLHSDMPNAPSKANTATTLP